MRIILDTNVIVSGLISEHGVTSMTQIAEISSVTHRPVVRPLITPSHAGRFINDR
jgi:predicted nucleic acid-binding protein